MYRIVETAMRSILMIVGLTQATACQAAPQSISPKDPSSPLKLERIIPLPDVAGRIDHLALDTAHGRLFVAEYGNGTVDEIDLAGGRVLGRIGGLYEPQGVAYLDRLDEIVVACGDGSVHFYAASDRREVAHLDLAGDADNVRIDSRNGHVIIGFGGGGLAIIDPANARVLNRVSLTGHPEGFRLRGSRAWINIPDRSAIVVADIDSGQVLSSWSTGMHRLNFPLAIEPSGREVVVAYRLPAALQRRDADTGAVIETLSACGDADDLFLDGERRYLICGAGRVDVSRQSQPRKSDLRVITTPGARTGLFSPELGKLFVSAPARGQQPAAIWVLDTAVAHR
jgi:DNA-binding beta-propeller fold protein YncE